MSPTYLTVEDWAYACRRCGHEWMTAYEKQYVAVTGSEMVTWRRGGHPCSTPWSDQSCPACGSNLVRLRPPVTVRRSASV